MREPLVIRIIALAFFAETLIPLPQCLRIVAPFITSPG